MVGRGFYILVLIQLILLPPVFGVFRASISLCLSFLFLLFSFFLLPLSILRVGHAMSGGRERRKQKNLSPLPQNIQKKKKKFHLA